MKKILATIMVAPILTLFVGVGILAFSVSNKWDERNTDVLITNLTMVCGIGGLVIALILGSFVSLAFYSRWMQERQLLPPPMWTPKPVRRNRLPNQQPAWMDSPPPLLTVADEPKGRLHSPGPSAYEDLDTSLFGDGGDEYPQTIETDWRETL